MTLKRQVQQPRMTSLWKAKSPSFCPHTRSIRLSNIEQTNNSLIARPLSGGPNCAMHGNELRLFWAGTFALL